MHLHHPIALEPSPAGRRPVPSRAAGLTAGGRLWISAQRLRCFTEPSCRAALLVRFLRPGLPGHGAGPCPAESVLLSAFYRNVACVQESAHLSMHPGLCAGAAALPLGAPR